VIFPLRILYLEDDAKDAELAQIMLESGGFTCHVTRVETQVDFRAALGWHGFNIILADYTLPAFDGISALKIAAEQRPELPFIFVSGTLGEEVAIEALNIGATDYVLKTRLSRLVPSVVRALREATERAERTLAEDSLRRSEAYLAEAQRLSHTGSFGWRPRNGEFYWSEETFRIFEYNPGSTPTLEMIQRRIHPDHATAFQQVVERAAEDGRDFTDEYRLRMPDGKDKHIHVVARAFRDERGQIDFVGAVMDVSQEKSARAEHERLEQRLRQAAKMEAVGRLAGGIAHDFNNILGAILGYGELARNNLGESSVERLQIDQMMQAGGRGKELVDRILAFSRGGMGKRVPLQVQSIVEETLDLLVPSLPTDVRLDRRLHAHDLAVVGDSTQFHQVVMNLCTNAVHAMEGCGVLGVILEHVAIGERRSLSHGTLRAGNYVCLRVSDSGSGIPPAVLERMFDPFFTTKRAGDGTGLGLAMVQGIVTDLGGVIDVATQIAVGTTFAIWLPATNEAPRLPAKPARELPRGHGQTVMIVDDERALVAIAEETLALLGYQPVGFDSSLAALQAFRAEPKRFDLVVTDETMPNLTGTELTREMRQLRPDIPILLMSGYSGTQLSERALAAGILEVLRKPLVRRDIAEPVARALQARD
jgi:signal transduction histidine kinase/FixJ family two-component response regulator